MVCRGDHAVDRNVYARCQTPTLVLMQVVVVAQRGGVGCLMRSLDVSTGRVSESAKLR
jgi:hypothetical protein